MSAPGAGEGVSWVDVAASAAGIYSQMESIGKQAAAGFSNAFNQGVSGAGLSSVFSKQGSAAAMHFGSAFKSAATSAVATVGFEAMLPQLTSRFSSAGRSAGAAWRNEISSAMSQGLLTDFERQLPQFTTVFGNVGKQSAAVLRKEMSAAMSQGLLTDFERQLPQFTTVFGNVGKQSAAVLRKEMSAAMDFHQSFEGALSRMGSAASTAFNSIGAEGVKRVAAHWDQIPATIAAQTTAKWLPIGEGMASSIIRGLQSTLPPGLAKIMEDIPVLRNIAPLFEKIGFDSASMLNKSIAQEAANLPKGMIPTWEAVERNFGAAASKAGTLAGGLLVAGIVGAVVVGAELVVDDFKKMLELVNKEAAAFGKVGKEAAEALMGGFKAVVEGEMPNIGQAFGVFEDLAKTSIELPLNGINTAIDATVGHIPIIGSAFKAVAGEAEQAIGAVFAFIDEYKNVATEFGNILLDIGEKWQEAGRAIAGQTLGTENLEQYLETVKDIAASGDLVHFKDVADIVGELHQRLEGLGDGAGITQQQLTELATTLAEGNELLGDIHINVDNLTAAFNAFNIEPEKTNEELTTLINLSRMTGASINDLTNDLDTTSPAWLALGFNMDQAAYIMAKVNEELGRPAMNRFSFSLAHLPEQLLKTNTSLDELNHVVKEYLAHGEDMLAIDYSQSFFTSAKAAENFVDAVKHGIPFAVEDAKAAMEANGEKLHQPIDEALEATKKFKDELEVLSNQVQSALAPLGMGLVESLNGVGDKVSNWLQTHQSEFIGFVGAIGEKLLEWGGKISHFLAEMIRDTSGMVQLFKNVTVYTLEVLNDMVVDITGIFAPISGAMRGMHDAAKAAQGPLKALHDLDLGAVMRAGATGVDALGNSLEGLEGPLKDLVTHSQDSASMWQAFRAEFAKPLEVNGKVQLDEQGHVKKEAAKLQDALGGSLKEGMTIEPDALDTVRGQLAKLGIDITTVIDPETGKAKITDFTAHTKKELDELETYLNTKFGPDKFAQLIGDNKIKFTVMDLPEQTTKEFLKTQGVPSEIVEKGGFDLDVNLVLKGLPEDQRKALETIMGAGTGTGQPAEAPAEPAHEGWSPYDVRQRIGDSIERLLGSWGFQVGGTVAGGAGGVDDVPALLTAGEKVMTVAANQRFGPVLDAMNAGAGPRGYAGGGDVLAAAGIPDTMRSGLTGQGIALPAGISVITPQPMTEDETLTRSGVPDRYQGDVTNEGVTTPGVSLPTGLDVKDGDRKDASDVMTSVGIPSNLQSGDGVKIGVKLELLAGEPLPEGTDTGTATGTGTGTGTGASGPGPGGDIQQQVIAAMAGGGVVGMREGGFPDSEFGPLSNLLQGESSWNPAARNPSSGAFGLFQFLGHEHDEYGQMGAYSTNPYQQAKAGIAYIKNRYGTPTNAYNTWLGRSPHWYQSGGSVDDGIGDKALSLLGGFLKGILGELGVTLPTGSGSMTGTLWDTLGSGSDTTGMQVGGMAGFKESPDDPHRPHQYVDDVYGVPIAGAPPPGGWDPSLDPDKFKADQFPLNKFGDDLAFFNARYSRMSPENRVKYAADLKKMRDDEKVSDFRGIYALWEAGKFTWEHFKKWPVLFPDVEQHQTGGHVQGSWWPGRDSVPMGLQPGSFVVNRSSSARYRDVLDQIMGGPGGAAGTHGRSVPTILEVGERVVPPHIAMPNAGLLHAINRGNLARRQGGGQTGVLQVIYNPPGTQEYFGEAAGFGLVGPGTGQPQYYSGEWSGHHGHVHTSFETGPDGKPYGMPLGTNLPGGKEHPEFASAGFPWVIALGRQYGVYASTYPGHQEHGGKNHGLDWWPAGKADMSGLSYTRQETDKLRAFASAIRSVGVSGGAAWGHGYAGTGVSASSAVNTGSAAISAASVRSRLKAALPPWLSRALGLQTGGPVIVPSPSGMLGGDGPDVTVDSSTGDDPDTTRIIVISGGKKIGKKGGATDPNLPKVPAPVGPGQPNVMPPPSWAQPVAAGTPNAIDVPGYGSFLYTMDMPDQGASMSQEQRQKYNEWLRKAENAAKKAVTDQTALDTATEDETAATIRLNSAKDQAAKDLAALHLDGLDQAAKDAVLKSDSPLAKAYAKSLKELTDATDHEVATKKKLTTTTDALHDAQRDAAMEADVTPPWVGKASTAATTPDANAAALGAGLIKGMAQELGFGDVFGKPPWEWGIWKLFAGGASYGLNLLNAISDQGATVAGMPGALPGTGPLPGGTGEAPAIPGADQHMPDQTAAGQAGTPDAAGVYTLADGTKDIPDAQGGYAKPHGDDWTYSAEAKRYYPPGKGPQTQTPAPTSTTGEQPGETGKSDWHGIKLGEGESWHIGGGGSRTKWKDGKPVPGESYDASGKKVGTGGAPPPAGQTPDATSMFLPPAGAPQAPSWLPGSPPGSPVPRTSSGQRPPGAAPPGMTWSESAHGWVPVTPDSVVPHAGESMPFSSGGPQIAGGGGFSMDWLMHPAGTAVREAYRRGDIQGPPWAGSVTSQMAASQTPANLPVSVAAGPTNNVSINTTNNGVLHGADEAAKMVTSAQVQRSGWHPSMQPVS